MSQPTYIGPRADINTVWKDGQWNSMRVLIAGAAPHITLWINDMKMWEAQLPTNDQIAGLYGGMIGLQLHWTAAIRQPPVHAAARPVRHRFSGFAIWPFES